MGNALNKKVGKKSLLAFGLIVNLSLLGYFKYFDFFMSNLNTVLGSNVSLLHLSLPLAISFFTFQQIAYLVDSYRNETKEYDFLNYALFVTFFPQLIAGPIVHHKEMMPQFTNIRNKTKNYKNIATGLFIFSIGLFKKVVIADTFAVWANEGFDTSVVLTLFEAWATSLAYTFQLYFDFSGYTDMAIGAALLFNITIPINFNSPYKALDIQDFWRRWHITLSRFLRDYVYIPLGGSKEGSFKTYYNLMATFILGGLWHGAGWTFIFWGVLHGMALVLHRLWKSLGFTMNKYLAWFITFNFINITWVFFRAKEWADALKVLSGMVGASGLMVAKNTLYKINILKEFIESNPEFFGQLLFGTSAFTWSITAIIIVIKVKNSSELTKMFKPNLVTFFIIYILFLFSLFNISQDSDFLYFNF